MVEGARLEIVWARKRLGGSNPLASARKSRKIAQRAILWTSLQKEGEIRARFASKTKFSIIYPLALLNIFCVFSKNLAGRFSLKNLKMALPPGK